MKSVVSLCGGLGLGAMLMVSPPRAAADTGTITTLFGTSLITNGPFTLGETGPGNALFIFFGGALSDTTGTIGNGPAAKGNSALVNGVGSTWLNTSNFILGATGSMNQLTVSEGAQAGAAWETILGLDAAATNNILLIDGAGSVWDINHFTLGLNGATNQVVVSNGGRLNGRVSFDVTHRIGSNSLANDNILQVSGPGSSATTDHLTVGYLGSRNVLEILGGARFTNATVVLGRETNSTGNRATLSGDGSLWQFVNSGLFLGLNGWGNSVAVTDGARLSQTDVTLGYGPSAANNTALVRGANSLWQCTAATVGRQGADNSFVISNGGRLLTGPLVIGDTGAGNRVVVTDGTLDGLSTTLGTASDANNNELLVTGPSAFLTNTSTVIVGSNGSFNRLILTNGARMLTSTVFTSPVSVGAALGSRSNIFVVTGTNTQFAGQRGLESGGAGSDNRVVFTAGAFAQTAGSYVGRACGANHNLLTVTGPGTVWSNSAFLDVGFCGFDNGLLVSNQARVLAGLVRSSVQGGGFNRIAVEGAGSLLSCSQGLQVGVAGRSNLLSVRQGARLEGRNDSIALGASALVSGPGSIWTNLDFFIGSSSQSNRLVLSNAAQMISANATLGGGASGPVSRYNEVLVTGAGSSWSVRSNLSVGPATPPHRMFITDGGRVSARQAYLGFLQTVGANQPWDGYNNLISVTGSNSLLEVSDLLCIGSNGPQNRLEIRDGARVTNRVAILGPATGAAQCSALVAGPGSLWTTDAELWIGGFGSGASLTVTNGARIRSGVGVIDASRFAIPTPPDCIEVDSSARAVIADPGSIWECATNLILGTVGRGNTLDIRKGGLVTTPALILSDASVSFGNFLCSAGQGRNYLTVDDGCLAVTNATRSGVLEIRNGVVFMQRGSIVLDELRATNRFYGLFYLLGGNARLRRAYLGTLPLTVGTGLGAARLFVDSIDGSVGWGFINAPAGVVIGPHSTLAGGVIVSGSVSNAGTLRPGGYGGSYFDFPSLTLAPSSALHFDIDGRLYTTNYHPITVGSPLALRGALRVALRGGFVPSPGDVFSVIGCSQVTNNFDNAPLGGRVKTTDGLGTFLVSFNGFNLNLSSYQSTDLDGDGLEDAWAMTHFGHSPLTAAERAADADGDGASNADEFRAGTDPRDAASVLRATLSFVGDRPAITFPCVDGKDYRLRVSDDLLTWRTVSEPAFIYPAPGMCSWADDGKDTGGLGAPARFYRVVVE